MLGLAHIDAQLCEWRIVGSGRYEPDASPQIGPIDEGKAIRGTYAPRQRLRRS